jgi:uncharacterized protein YcbX
MAISQISAPRSSLAPPEEREVVAHKSVAVGRMTPEEAVDEMELSTTTSSSSRARAATPSRTAVWGRRRSPGD